MRIPARLRARRDGALSRLIGSSFACAYLRLGSLSNNIWYANSTPDPQPSRWGLPLEFLICPEEKISSSQRAQWLRKGREIQQDTPMPASKWRATLTNGFTVEFIGICENPSAGRKWWGPDGSPLEYAPYCNPEPYAPNREDRKIYEIAWRVIDPDEPREHGTRLSLEGLVGSHFRRIRDRYGNPLTESLYAEGYAFPKSRKQTTLEFGLKSGDEDYQVVLFRNISLVPGRDGGFEIELQK